MPNPATVAECLRQAQTRGLARVDAQMLLLHSLQRPLHDRAWLMAHDSDTLTAAQSTAWQDALQRRLSGEPVAYITGRKDFFGLNLAVDARVLDPRPDTETLVEWALECLPETGTPRILDLGTGSGAVALALQHMRPNATVWAVDASEDALAVARANATRLHLGVQFIASNWLKAVDVQGTGRFELIVSNPPYVAEGDPHLAALRHEPLQALTSGPDGLDDIRQIIAQAPAFLAPGGWLLLEHGWDQAAAVQALLNESGFVQVQSRRDLGGMARCTGAAWPV
ncbi:peptide chain release factor N(5)-glutamine methyltransferase [Limnohabitans sp.]|uniref:peptide chain release factor N(5)-glutamine methyltransferase n=1 Tax=Limnohabitans sp. TaxID=1907725 RepID=UPI002AFF63CA|nr:peptide chain release factor N(5)-glutamine methyltransferase [Limnohabitans sp.]